MRKFRQLLLDGIKKIHRKTMCRKELYSLNYIIYKMSLHGIGILNYKNKSMSGEAFFIENALSSIDSPVVLDVGANIGEYSRKLSNEHPGSNIYAFEPHPGNFEELKTNIKKDNIFPIQKACGDSCESIKLFDYQDSGTTHASTVDGVIENIHRKSRTSVEVEMTTIDKFLSDRVIETVDLLKIDTEGSELDVLRGAKEFIEKGKIKCIQFEFNEMNVESRSFVLDFIEYLDKYDFYRMMPNGLVALGKYNPKKYEIFAYQNLVAILAGENEIIKNVT